MGMKNAIALRRRLSVGELQMILLFALSASAGDWPQYRGPTHDGVSTDRILLQWPPGGPTVLWRKPLTNGFSSFAVSQGRAFTLISRNIGGQLSEVCVGLDAATGTELWATPIGAASYPDGGTGLGSEDGPRTTPSAQDGRVFALSAYLTLVCLNATNGSVVWSNSLNALYGGTVIAWQNAASPRLDDDLLFVNCNTTNLTLLALRASDGSLAWRRQNERMTHSTPVVATIQGVKQVIFATQSGIVSLDRTNSGALLWKYTYPFAYSTSMGASPVVHSNMVFCSMNYNRGSAVARITLSNNVWTISQLWYKQLLMSHWMTPVCYRGYLYGQFNGSTVDAGPLKCIELATGTEKWSVANFGQGGIVLVDNTLLVQTSRGDLVLARATNSAYSELARFTALAGASWNSPAVADGRIYARSTREGIAVDIAAAPALPVVTTVGNTNLSATGVTLLGMVNPNGGTASAWFEWGTSTSYGSNTLVVANLSGNAPVAVAGALTGLAANATYHFRALASNAAGTGTGSDLTFTTLPLLRMTAPQFLASNSLILDVGNATGDPVNASRLGRIEVWASTNLAPYPMNWTKLTNSLVLTSDGLARLTNTSVPVRQFFMTVEQP